ncbi:endonuclease MutS2 [Robertkochia sediminum]|uniref:endonuclease MutS2 n=1 Tax=Robertkochia sediminum TaxID=2785326 RepID=UPI00193484CE|nr:DNA mismatch repair protein MutS [Robertkochia sediminum]MBL7473524.1 DNA mismatch repair protein MutS [Robertkochia sediminum]
MHKITEKTLNDLELNKVLEQISECCVTGPGRALALKTAPFREEEAIMSSLKQTHEYLASFENNNTIPNHYFDPIHEELKMLQIENSVLEIESFRKIAGISATVNEHLKFFKKFEEYYPHLASACNHMELTTLFVDETGKVIDRFGEIKDNASEALYHIRKAMGMVRNKINQSFGSALSNYASAGYLDDIRESVIDNKRVLAVTAMYRKRIKGSILGHSKTGSIVYMEPESTHQYNRELDNLKYEETEEIQRILKALTNTFRPFTALLADYQDYLSMTDLTAGKAKYAASINALLPEITKERVMHFREAYHPLLLVANRKENKPTYPQTVTLEQENRIIVISGPNAGGKSITLKTVGLLQLMLQCGILIPVHERSSTFLFDRILTDIGDNQSIENHLSTYSYRLKNMNYFLRKCNDRTLFLIDEFGTGSDPELGGALAETFLEVFYEREAYGIITTHYSNLKMLANELPHAMNANMMFDRRTLEPVFQLVLGEAGSSFTFEVAQKNGIPYSLINRAKKKIERGKVRFDATIAKLQKERSKMAKTSSSLKDEEEKTREEARKMEQLNTRLKSKLESYQELFDHNQRMIYLGNKINEIAEKYFINKKKRPLISEFLRIVETENSKRKKESAAKKRSERERKEVIAKELEKKVAVIREKKKEEKKKKAAEQVKPKPRPALKVGDRVRLEDGRAVGSIDTIEKNKAIVNYGMFTTSVALDKLELVEAKKRS